jgi:fibronectin-binding autotransporter adhesin
MMRNANDRRADSVLVNPTELKKSRMLRVIGAASAAVVAAIGVGPARGQTILFNDTNTTTAGLQTGGTWNATNKIWTPTATGASAADQTSWAAGAIASFGAGGTVTLNDQEKISGINITTGGVTITLNLASAAFTSAATTVNINSTSTGKQIIGVPWLGSYDIAYNYNANGTGGTQDLVGLQNWTGNLIVNNTNTGTHSLTTNGAVVQVNSTLGNPNAVIKLSDFAGLGMDNQMTFNSVLTPIQFSLPNNIIANYNAVNNASVELFQANGPTGTQEIETYAGVISSPTGVTTNVIFGFNTNQGRGTTVLANHNTYNGNTTIIMAGNNGLLQMGVDNALPSTTVLTFGLAGNNPIAPMDLNGHSQTIAGLSTGTTANTAVEGNIYNTYAVGGQETPVTLTIAGAANTTYKGNIGETDLAVNPFNDNAPYFVSAANTIAAGTNISLVINGPGSLTLAPVSGLKSAGSNVGTNEYTGTTTINGGSLIFGRTGAVANGLPGQSYTLSGGGAVTVNNGATIASVSAAPTSYVGGASGTITLNSGAAMTIGGVNGTGVLSTAGVNFNGGAAINFELASPSQFDQLYVNGALTLDNNDAHTINAAILGGATLTPGAYTLITTGGINSDGTHLFTAGNIPANSAIVQVGNNVRLDVLGNVVQWDTGNSGLPATEGGGTWGEGSNFINFSVAPIKDSPWSNASFANFGVNIGNDVTNGGGDIALSENISFNGALTFGPIFPGFNYIIDNNGFSLILGGGINVNNLAATNGGNPLAGGSPSAEINAPIQLAANQNWEVDPGQFLDVKGTLTEAGGLNQFTLTKTGAGTLFLESAGGSIGTLAVNAGLVLIKAPDAIGNGTIALNGGSVEATTTMSLNNPITIGASGGTIGETNGTLTVSQNFNTPNKLTIQGTTTGTTVLGGNNSFGTLELAGGTTSISSVNNVGATTPLLMDGGSLSMTGISSLPNNINTGTNTQANATIISDVPTTLAGNITGNGNVLLPSAEYTLSGASTLSQSGGGGGAINIQANNAIVHVTSATGLGSGTTVISGNTVTVDIETDVTSGAIRNNSTPNTVHKTGPGTWTVNGTAINSATGGALSIDQGNVQMGRLEALAGTNITGTPTALMITVNSGTALLLNWSGSGTRFSTNITLNGGALERMDNTVSGDYELSSFAGDGATPAFPGIAVPVLTVTASSTLLNLSQQPDVIATSRDLLLSMPVVINSGVTLTAQSAANSAGLNHHQAVIFRGVANDTTYPYQNIFLQPGATLATTGSGQVDFGGTGRGQPIIGNGTPGNESVLKLGATHTFLRDSGSATQGAAGTDMTRLVVNGSGNAGLRVEAPMNATYTKDTVNSTDDLNTTGLFGLNTVSGDPNGNGYTVFTPNRMNALRNNYTLSSGTIITPGGSLTLAASDAAGATGAAMAFGPSSAANVTLALDNTPLSGNLVYQIAGGMTFGNFAGLVVERSNLSAGTVAAKITGPTQVSTVALNNGTSLDMAGAMAVTGMAADTIRALITTGYAAGAWNGAGGINSSAAAADPNHSIAVGYGSPADLGITTLGTMPISNSSTIVKETYYGDGSLDGKVDLGNDFNLFLQGYLSSAPLPISELWELGDYNYDGFVTNADFQLFIDGYKTQGGSLGALNGVIEGSPFLSTVQKESLVSLVPEPGSLGLLTAASCAFMTRRRRRSL